MSKEEFLQALRTSLIGKVAAQIVNENMVYYEDYINTQMRLGRMEEDIMDQLGDPRLIAKTIVSTIEIEKEQKQNYYKEDDRTQEKATNNMNFFVRLLRFNEWPWWGYMLIPVGVVALIVLILFLLWIFSMLLPIIVVALVAGALLIVIVKVFKELLK